MKMPRTLMLESTPRASATVATDRRRSRGSPPWLDGPVPAGTVSRGYGPLVPRRTPGSSTPLSTEAYWGCGERGAEWRAYELRHLCGCQYGDPTVRRHGLRAGVAAAPRRRPPPALPPLPA